MLKRIAISVVFALGVQLCMAQIVNIEEKRIVTDTTGWSGHIGLAVAAAKNTKSFVTISSSGHLQFKTKKGFYLLVGNYDLVNGDGESFDKRGFGHFRYNRKISEVIRLEFFSQIQFNRLIKIDQRLLNGVGARFKLSKYEKAKFYFGLAYMNEFEDLTDPDIINRDHRLSSYITFTLVPESVVKFTNTSYIQPLINDFNDYRFSNETAFTFDITEHLKFSTTFNFLYDSNPPIAVPKIIYAINNGIRYKF